MKQTFLIALSLLILICVRTNTFAQAPGMKESLKGLSSVGLLIEDIPEEVAGKGLSKASLQTEAEAKLRKAGIRVLTQSEALKTEGMPMLYLRLNLHKTDVSPYAYYMEATFSQSISLLRNPTIRVLAETWQDYGEVGIVGAAKVDTLRVALMKRLDNFILDFKSINQLSRVEETTR